VPPAGFGEFNLEGPVWIAGALYVSEIADTGTPPDARVLKYTPGTGVEVFIENAGTNGLAVGPDGALYGAVHTSGTISRFDLQNPQAAPTVVAGMYDGIRFNSPNDLTFRDDGVLYFTDPDWQAGSERQAEERAYWVSTEGAITPIDGAPSKPNGITLSPDQNTLYIAGTSDLMAFPVNTDGSVGTGSPFGTGHSGNDGMGVDCAGNLYVTEESNVVVLSPAGDVIGSLSVASGVTNVAFGGSSGTTVYITKLNPPELYEVDVGIPGYPY
jgi:gluconolactonase